MVKLIIIAVILAGLAAGIGVAYKAVFQSGVNAERTRQSDARAGKQTAEKETVKEIIKWRDKERIIYRDRIQTIHTAADPTGCLDTDLRDAGLSFMLPATKAPSSH